MIPVAVTLINAALLLRALYLINDGINDGLTIVLALASAIITMIYVLRSYEAFEKKGPSVLGLYLKRKALEEQQKIDSLNKT